jgi:hypothetical protein
MGRLTTYMFMKNPSANSASPIFGGEVGECPSFLCIIGSAPLGVAPRLDPASLACHVIDVSSSLSSLMMADDEDATADEYLPSCRCCWCLRSLAVCLRSTSEVWSWK